MKDKFYLNEFQFFDGENTIIFNIVEVNENNRTITVAVTRQGKISIIEYDLFSDKKGLYFEYGAGGSEHIHVNDFE